jgi:hypothetical protein
VTVVRAVLQASNHMIIVIACSCVGSEEMPCSYCKKTCHNPLAWAMHYYSPGRIRAIGPGTTVALRIGRAQIGATWVGAAFTNTMCWGVGKGGEVVVRGLCEGLDSAAWCMHG